MNPFKWFDATEAHQFGTSLAQLLIERTPKDSAIKDKALSKKHEAMLNKLSQEITSFKAKCKLNVYQKAKLGNAFKWALLEAQYDEEYVNQMTQWIIVMLGSM